MNTFFRFFYEFISIFFDGIATIGRGIAKGLGHAFDFNAYLRIIASYKESFDGVGWLMVTIAIAFLVIILFLIGLLIFFAVRRFIKLRKSGLNQEDLLEEIGNLNQQVRKLMKEKDELMAMKVSQLGLNPDDEEASSGSGTPGTDEDLTEEEIEEKNALDIRFPKLRKLDEEYEDYRVQNYGASYTLEEVVDCFRCFAASKMKLYYDASLLRAFVAGLACGRLIILQGISGTGKTSLAYAWGKFVRNDSCVASVQPSWRDKTEFVGYFNEFTKKFNETEALAELYKAGHDDDVHTIILDEMNIARVEYYFAEMLSILEIPNRKEWIIELVTDSWAKDPKKVVKGKIQIPENVWYIGTINNDDSTFAVTDKVYDRALPIDINTKVSPFKCREQEAIEINFSYLEDLFKDAIANITISEKSLTKVIEMDDYVIEHFRIAFGNRIMKQLNTFVAVYVACGGDELEAIDYFMARKVIRKFEQLNMMFIRDEFDPFIKFLDKTFGKGTMKEITEIIQRLKKSS